MANRILVRSISNLPIGKLARANGPSLSFVGLCLKPPGTLEMLIPAEMERLWSVLLTKQESVGMKLRISVECSNLHQGKSYFSIHHSLHILKQLKSWTGKNFCWFNQAWLIFQACGISYAFEMPEMRNNILITLLYFCYFWWEDGFF